MQESYTPGAERALRRALARAAAAGRSLVEPVDLLTALADEPESRAGELLGRHGLPPETLAAILGAAAAPDIDEVAPADPIPAPVHSGELRLLLGEALQRVRSVDRSRDVGTEDLLATLLASPSADVRRLEAAGLDVPALLQQLTQPERTSAEPIPIATEIGSLELLEPGETVDLARILDAAANRSREGLRVVEDYVRFALDDPMLTRRLKDVRHRLAQATTALGLDDRITARDTRGDVGTHIMTVSEQVRENPRGVLVANLKRTGEALRSLEEYAKLVDVWLAGRFEVLRYDVYTLEKLILTALASHAELGEARLYLLVGGLPTLGDLRWIVEEALAGGVQVVQLREKDLPDREWLTRAREVRLLTRGARAAFILNDRPDLARLAAADGVHLGQDDMTVRDARRILGTRSVIGVSTHDREQLERAVLDGASYLGVGPVFPSATKDFPDFAGPAFVRHAAETSTLPWFAIGGITEENVDEVIAAGARRIAVSSAIVQAPSPREAARALREKLDASRED